MLENTKTIIRAAVAADPTITNEMLVAGLAALSGNAAANIKDTEPLDECLTRKQCADILGVTPRTVTGYAARGLISPFRCGELGKRATGYSRRSVKAFQTQYTNRSA